MVQGDATSADGTTNGLFSERELTLNEYEFLKSYLYAVYLGNFSDPAIHIHRCVGRSSLGGRPCVPTQIDEASKSFSLIGDDILMLTIEWNGAVYDVHVAREQAPHEGSKTNAYCLGLSGNAVSPKDLIELLLRKAVGNSLFKNQVIRLFMGENRDSVLMRSVLVPSKQLTSLCLSDDVTEAVSLFTKAVASFSSLRTPLRYLFSGQPGTGKTETIRAVINECRGKATFILVEPDVNIKTAFELAACFEPAIVCLDDVDLLCGDRHFGRPRMALSDFLGIMDGFIPSHVFVLATTNDKSLVDAAASRPGRFDSILDFSHLEAEHLERLIGERARIPAIRELFNERIYRRLEERKVTGAFVVSLLKNLELRHSLNNEVFDMDGVMKTIDRMHKGFYKDPDEVENAFGFVGEN
jgi:hypothetical protein